MTAHRPTGWNTWDFRGFNRLVYLHNGQVRLKVLCGIWDETVPPPPFARKPGKILDTFRWSDVVRIGPHAPLGLPAELEFNAGPTPYRFEAVDEAGTLRVTLAPLAATQQRVAFVFLVPADTPPVVKSPQAGTFAGFAVEFDGAEWPRRFFLNVNEPFALGEPGTPATMRIRGGAAAASGTFAAYEAGRLTGGGALAEAPAAMVQAVGWNTLYDPLSRLVSSPVSRDWCVDWGGPAVFGWDTYFLGALISQESPELGRMNFEAVNAGIDRFGFVPNYVVAHGAASLDRSMPPIGAYLIWKTQVLQPDRPWLVRTYRQLARWHEFWPRHRDGNGNGLLEWGSNREPDYEYPQLCTDEVHIRHSLQAAKWESGLDNSPMFDGVGFNEQAGTLELDDLALSCYFAMDAAALAAMAAFLGRRSQATAYRRQYEELGRRINEHLWDEEHGIYCNRHWDRRLSPRWSPTSFFPMVAGIAPSQRAERLVREHLLNPREFWGEWVIPSIARSDPAYPDNDYWRGRIWGPFNFLVAEGLRRYRYDDIAAKLAAKSLALFLKNWRADGGIYENYNADTGRGGDVWNAARLYHWGGLLAYVAIQELIDIEAAGYLRLGSLKFPNAAIRNVHAGGAVYDVELADGLHVQRNGSVFLECTTRAIIRIPVAPRAGEPLEITAAGPGRLVLQDDQTPVRPARVNGTQLIEPSAASPAVYSW